MAVTTPDNIVTPDDGDDYALVQDLGALADSVQEAITGWKNYGVGTNAGRLSLTGSSNPPLKDGLLWYSTDTNDLNIYNGSSWEAVRSLSGSTSNRTSFTGTFAGLLWYDTTLSALFVYSAGAWTRLTPARGSVSTSTSAGGIVTVTHGLGTTPSQVVVTDNASVGAAPGTRLVKVNSITPTQIQFIVFNGGSALGSNPVGFYWVAYP